MTTLRDPEPEKGVECMVVGMERNEYNANNVNIVHRGNTNPNDIQFTNAYGTNGPNECGVNALQITNTNPNSGIDGLGECIKDADINIQHKPSSQNMHCKQLERMMMRMYNYQPQRVLMFVVAYKGCVVL